MRRFPLLGDDLPDRWNVRFTVGFHKIDGSGLFRDAPAKGRLPLYEGRMIWQFDHRLAEPRYWVDEMEGRSAYLGRERDDGQQLPYESSCIAFRSAARTTNERTMVATVLPPLTFCEHSLSVSTGVSSAADQVYLAAVLNSFVFDFSLRARLSKNLTLPLLYQMPVPRLPSNDPSRAPIVERAMRLICTTPEFDEVAKDAGIRSHTQGVSDPATRASLRAELDGLVADLYGLSEREFAHILSTFPLVPDPVKVAAQNAYRDVERGLIQ
jgi:hypothetical protein